MEMKDICTARMVPINGQSQFYEHLRKELYAIMTKNHSAINRASNKLKENKGMAA